MQVQTNLLDDQALMNDQALMSRVRSGDVEAEGILYRVHARSALRRAMSHGTQPADAEDIVAEAFVRVLCHLRKGNGPDGPFRPYLFAALRHVAADGYRGQSARERPNEELTMPNDFRTGSLDPQLEVERRQCIQSAMLALPNRWREVLWRLDVEGHTPGNLAAELGTSAQSISALAYRARKALRRAYEDANADRRRRIAKTVTPAFAGPSQHENTPHGSIQGPRPSMSAVTQPSAAMLRERELLRLVLVEVAGSPPTSSTRQEPSYDVDATMLSA